MSKELKAFYELIDELQNTDGYFLDKEDYNVVEKGIKALKIIKEKWVNIETIKTSKCLEDYNTTLCFHDLTQDEFDLLKEVLC